MLCPVCKSSNTRFFATGWDSEYHSIKGTFEYDSCDDCSVVFLNPPLVDRLKEIYPRNYYSFSDDVGHSLLHRIKHRLEVRMLRKLLRSIPGEQLSALDVGGGNGWMLNTVRAADPRITETHIVDIDPSARPAAESDGHVFHCQLVEDYSTTKKFDCILLLNLLEHSAAPAAVLTKLATILSPKGLILIKTPNIDTLDRYLFQNHNWGGLHCPRHWVLFNTAGLLSLVRRCGLDVVSFSYTQGAPQWTASILGLLADKGVISITAKRPMHLHPLFGPIIALTGAFDFMRMPFSATAQVFCVIGLPMKQELFT